MNRSGYLLYGCVLAVVMVGTLHIYARPAVPARQSPPAADAKDGVDWPVTGGDLGNTRYSPLARITTQNIAQLGAAWMSKPFADHASSRSTPIVHDDLIFVTAGAQAYALNARTGDAVWTWRSDAKKVIDVAENLGLVESLQQGHGLPSPGGVAVGEGLVFLGLTDGHVVALREKTGELVWVRQTGEDPAPRGQSVSGAPIYARGLVFTGLANGDWSIRGRVVALDAKTGKEIWHFFSIPGPGEVGHETWPGSAIWQKGGAGVWFTGSVDADLGLVYFVTGNAVPYYGGEEREGDNLFAASMVALDMRTGKHQWHFQLVRHDIWEADVRSSPILFDFDVNGQKHKAVALMRGDGYIFILDRATGKPLLPVEDRPVMQEPRLKTAKTQPYPVGGESILPTCAWWKDKVPPGFTMAPAECGFVPPFFDRFNVVAPQPGVRGSMSYSPDTRYLYLQGASQLSRAHRVGADPWILDTGENVLSLFNLPTVRVLAAVDTTTNKVVWRKDIGPIPLAPSAPLTTAGGLLFRGEVDGNFEAYNSRTGDRVWRFQMGTTSARSAPSTYLLDGQQYVAIAAGSSVWAFTLGGKIPQQPASTKSDLGNFYARSATDEDADVVEMARLVPSMVLGSGRRYAIDEHSFQPLSARVKVGTRLRFVNNGNLTHTLAARDGSWKTTQMPPGFDAYVIFSKPGSYIYECTEHPGVIGRVVVVP